MGPLAVPGPDGDVVVFPGDTACTDPVTKENAAVRAGTTDDPLIAISLGAGVQSTTLALMAEEGALPRPDVAIFADTGWEPAAVYEHLARLEQAVSFPVIRVSNGNLRRDALDPDHRYASVPYHTIWPEGTQVPVQVTCTTCGGRGSGIYDEESELYCGTCDGAGQHDDPTGATRPMSPRERLGMGRRQCTHEYKLKPITRKLRELLGAQAPDYRRVPRGRLAEQWVGFSTDEVERANRRKDSQGVSYLSTRYPLLDLGMSRNDCMRWLTARGWGSTAKSACIGCPYHGNRQWRELRDGNPAEWADAVEFDKAIRKGGARGTALTGEAFLHGSRVPLDQAPIDRVTRREWKEAQVDLFDAVADAELEEQLRLAEEGSPDGCSPYGCRSGVETSGPVPIALLPTRVG